MTHGRKRGRGGQWQLAVKNVLLLSVAGLLVGAILLTSDNPVSRFVESLTTEDQVTSLVQGGEDPIEGVGLVDSNVTEDSVLPEADASGAGEWACFWDPTTNDNWHDDMLCTDGVADVRPLLLEGQFVTRDDMEAAGQRHADELNGR